MKISTVDRKTVEYIEEHITFEGTEYYRREDKVDGRTQEIVWSLLDNDGDVGTTVEKFTRIKGWVNGDSFTIVLPELELIYANIMANRL